MRGAKGKRYLGSVSVTTNASGNAAISATLPVAGLLGQAISATATAANGDTSEFSKDVTATANALLAAVNLGSANATGPAHGSEEVSSQTTRSVAPALSDLQLASALEDGWAGHVEVRPSTPAAAKSLAPLHHPDRQAPDGLASLEEWAPPQGETMK
jgi:hypothetical protein